MNKIEVNVSSEIGKLEAVIVHTPGQEVANMTPENAERALYSDILNLSIAQNEYAQFKGVLQKHAQVFEMRDLLNDILKDDELKHKLLTGIFKHENIDHNIQVLLDLKSEDLTRQLIEGVVMSKDTLTRYFNKERYSLRPLHNFFFMRDASMTINSEVLIGRMSSWVRDRETRIMEAIFNHHPLFETRTINPSKIEVNNKAITIEGGDVQIVRKDVLLVGTGARTSSQGIDFILNQVKSKNQIKHIIVQELPEFPESFIHLDMVFTVLDVNKCMVFEPVILGQNKHRTVRITIDNGEVEISSEENILVALRKLGIDLEPIFCGGQADSWIQEREQWHSGANFLTLAPGKAIGYERNANTMNEMNKHGFSIINATDILKGSVNLSDYEKYVVTINGSELARGGGGARCMSMPVRRSLVNW